MHTWGLCISQTWDVSQQSCLLWFYMYRWVTRSILHRYVSIFDNDNFDCHVQIHVVQHSVEVPPAATPPPSVVVWITRQSAPVLLGPQENQDQEASVAGAQEEESDQELEEWAHLCVIQTLVELMLIVKWEVIIPETQDLSAHVRKYSIDNALAHMFN